MLPAPAAKTIAERAQRHRHHRAADEQQRPATGPVEQPDRDQGHADVDDPDRDRGQDRGRRGLDAGELDDRRRVVDHRVDARDLLQDREPDPDHESGLDQRLAQVTPATRLGADLALDLDDLLLDRLGVAGADPRQHRPRLEVAPRHHQPARALRHPQHPDPERECGDGAEAQHPPPRLAVVEGEPDHVGDDDADRDRQLEEGDQAPADVGRRNLGDVDGRRRRGEPDRDAEDHPGDHQDGGVGRGGANQRADEEDDRGGEDQHPAAVGVREPAGEAGAEHGADRHRADDEPGLEAGEVEVRGDEQQRPGDDAGVVAEQQAAEPGDRRRHHDVAADLPGIDRRLPLHGPRQPIPAARGGD